MLQGGHSMWKVGGFKARETSLKMDLVLESSGT